MFDVPPAYAEMEARAQKALAMQRQPSANTTDNKPFRVALIMFRVSKAHVDSKGILHHSKILKVKCGSIMMRRNMTEKEFRKLQWDCIYDAYKLHGWKCAPRTDEQMAAGTAYVTVEDWKAAIARLADEKDAGKDPVYRLSFSWTNGERVKTEKDSELSFSLKLLLDRLLMRRGR